MVTHIFQEFFRVDAVCFDFSEGFALGDSSFDCFIVCHGAISLLSETKPYENRCGSYQKDLPVHVTVLGARKLLFTWEILASDIYLGRVRFTPEERSGFQFPEWNNLFDGGVVVDLAWHGFSPSDFDELNMGSGFSVSRGRTKKSEGEFFFIYRV
jgi:hypothetical protein